MVERHTSTILVVVLALIPGSSFATDFGGPLATSGISAAKREAEAAYNAGQYDKARRLYLETLAPAGDKYAQYSLGWMYLNGLGVERDRALGAAWLELAAERADRQLEESRDQAFAELHGDVREAALRQVEILRAQYGDCAVTQAFLVSEKKLLRPKTGSRIAGSDSSPVQVINYGSHLSAREADRITQYQLRKSVDLRRRFLRNHCD